jgi:hypothetical protein
VLKNLKSVLSAICRTIIAGAFWLASRIFHAVEVHGVELDSVAPRTYYGILHKRDLDPIIILPSVVFHRGWRGLAGDLHFILRSDGFTPGFLGRLVMHPGWLSRMLRLLAIGSVLRWLGAHPVQDLLRPTEEWTREALQLSAESYVADVFTSDFIEEFAAVTGEDREQIASDHLSHLLAWRYHHALQQYYGSEILVQSMRRRIERRMIERIKDSITELNTWVSGGGSLFGSPEGHLSPDGKVSPINSGLHRILRHIPSDTSIIPISIMYDFMTVKRMRIFVDFTSPIEQASLLPTNELDSQLRQAWLRSAHITTTQLASGFLIHVKRKGLTTFTLEDIVDDLYHQAVELANSGRNIDRCLHNKNRSRKRTLAFLSYAERHNLIHRVGTHAWELTFDETPIHVGPREVGYDQSPLVYAWNELQELLSI